MWVGSGDYATRLGAGRGVAGVDARGTGATAWATGTQCPRFGKLVPGSATQEHAYAYRLVYKDMNRITKIVMPFEETDHPRETNVKLQVLSELTVLR